MTISKSLVWNKLRTALGELRHSLMASQLHDVLDQEIKDADHQLRSLQARHEQAKTLVSHTQKHIQTLQDTHKDTKSAISKLLRSKKEEEARELAVQAAQQVKQLDEWGQRLLSAQHDERFAQLAAEQMTGELRRLKCQLGAIKTSDTLRRTQEVLVKQEKRTTPSTVLDAKDRQQDQHASSPSPAASDVDAILKELAPKNSKSSPAKTARSKSKSRKSSSKDRS